MTRYMLDTNTVSYLLRGHVLVTQQALAKVHLCISSITQGEILFGIALRPGAIFLPVQVGELFSRLEILSWDSAIAETCSQLRAALHRAGKRIAPLDMLIAAHAIGVGAVLVTSDKAFRQIAGLQVEDWTAPLG